MFIFIMKVFLHILIFFIDTVDAINVRKEKSAKLMGTSKIMIVESTAHVYFHILLEYHNKRN